MGKKLMVKLFLGWYIASGLLIIWLIGIQLFFGISFWFGSFFILFGTGIVAHGIAEYRKFCKYSRETKADK